MTDGQQVQQFVVCDDEGPLERLADLLRRQGWRIVHGFAGGSGLACFGRVDGPAEAEAAMLAAVAGASLVIVLTALPHLAHPFLNDLRHLGQVWTSSRAIETWAAQPHVTDDERRLLVLIADGATVSDAARQAAMSRRTATRRLTELRARLGVSTNAEAVIAVQHDLR